MGTFVTAYLMVWLAVAIYVYRMGERQRRLEKELALLQRRIDESDTRDEEYSQAA
jgi:CcmD family protein